MAPSSPPTPSISRAGRACRSSTPTRRAAAARPTRSRRTSRSCSRWSSSTTSPAPTPATCAGSPRAKSSSACWRRRSTACAATPAACRSRRRSCTTSTTRRSTSTSTSSRRASTASSRTRRSSSDRPRVPRRRRPADRDADHVRRQPPGAQQVPQQVPGAPVPHPVGREGALPIGRVCRDAGGLQIETPIMYDVNHPALNKYLNKFPARQYRIQSDEKELFLRFAACFGMYLTMGRATLSYKHLPARIYELTHYSFRREQSGETAGIKRLRCFTMPDMHTLVADLEQARGEFKAQFDRSKAWMDGLEVPYETAVRFVRSFYEQNKDFATSLAKTVNQPVLVEMWEQQSFYFVMKFEFNFNDTVIKEFALSTVQIDTQNPESFGIQYTASDGSRRHP